MGVSDLMTSSGLLYFQNEFFFFFFLKLRIKLSTKRGFDVPGEKLCVASYCYFVLSEINIEIMYFEQGFFKMNKVALKQLDQADIIFFPYQVSTSPSG